MHASHDGGGLIKPLKVLSAAEFAAAIEIAAVINRALRRLPYFADLFHRHGLSHAFKRLISAFEEVDIHLTELGRLGNETLV